MSATCVAPSSCFPVSCARAPNIAVVVVTDIGSGADFVREGLGVAFLPLFVVPDERGLIFKRVRDADLEWPLGIAVPSLRAQEAAARALLALIDARVG